MFILKNRGHNIVVDADKDKYHLVYDDNNLPFVPLGKYDKDMEQLLLAEWLYGGKYNKDLKAYLINEECKKIG